MTTYQVTIHESSHVLSRTTQIGDGGDVPRVVAQAVQSALHPGSARLSVWHRAVRPGVMWDYEVDLVPQTGVARTLSVHVTVPIPHAS